MSTFRDSPRSAPSATGETAPAPCFALLSIVAAQAVLATAFVAAGVLKIWAGPAALHPILAALGVAPIVRSDLAYAVPAAEVALGLWLVSGFAPRVCCSCTITILAAFVMILVAVGIRTDWQLSCACLGPADRSLETGIAQDALLLALAGLLAWRLRGANRHGTMTR